MGKAARESCVAGVGTTHASLMGSGGWDAASCPRPWMHLKLQREHGSKIRGGSYRVGFRHELQILRADPGSIPTPVLPCRRPGSFVHQECQWAGFCPTSSVGSAALQGPSPRCPAPFLLSGLSELPLALWLQNKILCPRGGRCLVSRRCCQRMGRVRLPK